MDKVFARARTAFVPLVCANDPELASYLRIEERELVGHGVPQRTRAPLMIVARTGSFFPPAR